ncbi:MAG TPA: hypothetical protein VF396_24595, partial [Bradyrhizobium sp.]
MTNINRTNPIIVAPFFIAGGRLRQELIRFLWGQHPIAAERVPGLFSDREARTLLPKSTVSRRTIAGTDCELEPSDKKCPTVAR